MALPRLRPRVRDSFPAPIYLIPLPKWALPPLPQRFWSFRLSDGGKSSCCFGRLWTLSQRRDNGMRRTFSQLTPWPCPRIMVPAIRVLCAIPKPPCLLRMHHSRVRQSVSGVSEKAQHSPRLMADQVDWTVWAPTASAAAAAVAAGIAAVNVWYQNRNARRSRAIDLLLKKETEFVSDRMEKRRSSAAKLLLAKSPSTRDIRSVLDFMESVGALVEDDDLEVEFAWRTFYYWFSHYYYAAETLIKAEQETDPLVWKCLTHLHNRMETLQTRQGGKSLPNKLPAEIAKFLNDEAALLA